MHDYKCGNCEYKMCDFLHISSDIPDRKQCPKCLFFSMVREISVPHTHRDFNKPIEHYSCAPTDPEDVMALRQKLSNEIQMSTDPDDPMYGIPISRNETERQAVLKAVGFVDKGHPR